MKHAFLPGVVLLSLCIRPAISADSIGFVYVEGSYRVNGAAVRGNATLFDGALLETGDAPARLQLDDGRRVWLTPGSRVSVSQRSVVLVKGLGQYQGPQGSVMEAGAIRVVASVPDTVVRVAIEKGGAAVVAPSQGAVDVMNLRGVRVGSLERGAAVRYAEQPGPAAAVLISGCLRRDGDRLAITDRITNVPMRLKGSGWSNDVGYPVRVSGLQEGGSGIEEVTIQKIERLAETLCSPQLLARAAAPLLASASNWNAAEQLPRTAPAALNLVIVEGEGAINNIRQRIAREPIVQVEDENHRPVAGAAVLFALPRSGPSGTFANGSRTLRVTTDQQGRAVGRGLRPNNVAGKFQIAVSASFGGLTAAISIAQSNTLAAAGAVSSGAAGAAESSAGGAAGGAVAGGAPSGGATTAGAGAGGATAGSATGGGAAAGRATSGGAPGGGAAAGGAASGGAAAGGAASGGAAGGGAVAGGAPGGGAAGGGAPAGGAPGGGATAGGGSGGVSTGARVAIIGGVAASAVVGGLAAGGVIFGGGSAATPASR